MAGYRLGIDVGGTNTDAVILDERNQVTAKCKRPTTPDVSTGIKNAVAQVLQESNVEPSSIGDAMLGTTHATNAIVERKGLSRVGIIRIGAPSGFAIPPLTDWPSDLVATIGEPFAIVRGGYEYNGAILSSMDALEIENALEKLKRSGIESLAVCGVFSPVSGAQEEKVAEIAAKVFGPDFPITLSHKIGSIGLLERENASILNAAIRKLANNAYSSFTEVLRSFGVEADLFITQNDGTLMSIDYAREYPVLTIASGPTNSLRGAAFLSGLQEAVVIDVGGTTTDVGVLIKGFPRESSSAATIGGVRTNFRMPDLLSIGLGGGSYVQPSNSAVAIGPSSAGFKITDEALVFGGTSLTATDIAVAAGAALIGDAAKVAGLSRQLVEESLRKIRTTVEEVVDKMKTSSEDMPIVAVGGGSILVSDSLNGASRVVKPDHFEVANAIGAAIAQVSGSIDGVYDVATRGRDAVVEDVKRAAVEEAVRAGAEGATVEVVELEEIPLAYLPSNAVRFRVKAVGSLARR